jgi:hypothetical protein
MIYLLRCGLFALIATWTSAAMSNGAIFVATPVPTLDEFGLGALAVLIGGVAGWAARRKNRK